MFLSFLNNMVTMVALLFIAEKFFAGRPLSTASRLSTRVFAGLGAGVLGILLLINSVPLPDHPWIDFRHQALIVAAIFGGPVSSLIAGIMIGVAQLALVGFQSFSIVLTGLTLFLGVLLGFLAVLDITTTQKFIIMNLLSILLGSLFPVSFLRPPQLFSDVLFYYISFSIIIGILTYYTTSFIQKSNEMQRDSKYYKLIADHSKDVISTHSGGRKFLYISPSSKDVLGYIPDDLIGKNVYQFIHPEDRESILTPSASSSAEAKTLLFRFLHQRGYYIWIEATFNRIIRETESEEFIYLSRDVTDRREAEKRIVDQNRELEQKNLELKKLSGLDGLTNLLNRRSFDEHLATEWQKGRQMDAAVSLILFDLDNFKIYNDTYGHLKGDDCLREVADIVQGLARTTDFVARYGGEEFAVILPDTTRVEALIIAEQIREDIYEAAIPNIYSDVTSLLTTSVGVSTIYPSSYSGDETSLISQADQALYKAKEYGRNRIAFY